MDLAHPITINGNTLTPGGRALFSFDPLARNAEETDYIILQTNKEVLEDDDYNSLDSNGV